MRRILLLCATSLVAALAASCSATPQKITPLPDAPSTQPLGEQPVAPPPPVAPRRASFPVPTPPKGRKQTIDDVFEEAVSIDAVPGAFPFEPNTDVVVSVPPKTLPDHRAGLIGAFLAAGYPVKDAGEFSVATFHVNNRPWWYDRDGFERLQVPEGVDLEDLKDLPIEKYDGLSGMEVSLKDPTSLWAPDLLANQNLESDYFLRLFELEFDDVVTTCTIEDLYDPEDVDRYRSQLRAANDSIRSYNASVRRFQADCEAYVLQYKEYSDRFDQWEASERDAYSRRYQDYSRQWSSWNTVNAQAIASQESAGTMQASWRAPAPQSSDLPLGAKEVETRLPDREPAEAFDAEALEAKLGNRGDVTVACRRLKILAEVIDAKTGHVVWVGRAEAIARDDRSDAYLLRETIGRLTER
ncbi:MAG: hypothetical protein AAF726_16960 [Planctomycetota bacterium]